MQVAQRPPHRVCELRLRERQHRPVLALGVGHRRVVAELASGHPLEPFHAADPAPVAREHPVLPPADLEVGLRSPIEVDVVHQRRHRLRIGGHDVVPGKTRAPQPLLHAAHGHHVERARRRLVDVAIDQKPGEEHLVSRARRRVALRVSPHRACRGIAREVLLAGLVQSDLRSKAQQLGSTAPEDVEPRGLALAASARRSPPTPLPRGARPGSRWPPRRRPAARRRTPPRGSSNPTTPPPPGFPDAGRSDPRARARARDPRFPRSARRRVDAPAGAPPDRRPDRASAGPRRSPPARGRAETGRTSRAP